MFKLFDKIIRKKPSHKITGWPLVFLITFFFIFLIQILILIILMKIIN